MKSVAMRSQISRGSLKCPGIAATILLLMGVIAPAIGEPWVEVGDGVMRGDLELLQSHGLIDGPLTTWPVPAGELARLSENPKLQDESDEVRLAAKRVLNRLLGDGQPQGLVKEARFSTTNEPDLIRGFDALARQDYNGEVGLVWDSDHLSTGLRISSEPREDSHDAQVALDGSYLSALLGNVQVYGGLVDKWYGPGWTSSLTLSNNARPVPKVGFMRNDPKAPETSWLSWIGPWQFDTFVGVLNDARKDSDTILAGVRLTLMPIRHVELGVGRLSMLCGQNHPCNPITGELHFQNTNSNPSPVHDQGTVDVKYNSRFGVLQISPYAQIMNRDNGPFTHSAASYLAGMSLAGPVGQGGSMWRMTIEYADTVATENWFDFGKKLYGVAYDDYKYTDGNHFHGRTLGFSLDTDSRLFSFVDTYTDSNGRSYRVAYYRADINQAPPGTTAPDGGPSNIITSQPVTIDQGELGLRLPLRPFTVDAAMRYQDAQVPPGAGGKWAGELTLSYRF